MKKKNQEKNQVKLHVFLIEPLETYRFPEYYVRPIKQEKLTDYGVEGVSCRLKKESRKKEENRE